MRLKRSTVKSQLSSSGELGIPLGFILISLPSLTTIEVASSPMVTTLKRSPVLLSTHFTFPDHEVAWIWDSFAVYDTAVHRSANLFNTPSRHLRTETVADSPSFGLRRAERLPYGVSFRRILPVLGESNLHQWSPSSAVQVFRFSGLPARDSAVGTPPPVPSVPSQRRSSMSPSCEDPPPCLPAQMCPGT